MSELVFEATMVRQSGIGGIIAVFRHNAKGSREWHLTELRTHGARADQFQEPVKEQNRDALNSSRDSRMKSDFFREQKKISKNFEKLRKSSQKILKREKF